MDTVLLVQPLYPNTNTFGISDRAAALLETSIGLGMPYTEFFGKPWP